ncbi:hypothetical protein D3C81_1026610 [compost metagenome]
MHFDQHVEVEVLGHRSQFRHARIFQGGHDQQDAVGTDGARFDHLVGIDHEVLADHRQLAGRAGFLQVGIAAKEEVHIGEHRQAGGSAFLVAAGDFGRHEVLAQHALARRSLLDLGDHRRLLALGALQQRVGEAARGVRAARQLFQFGQADAGTTFGDFFDLAGKDLLQNRGHTHCAFSSR